MIEMNGKVEEAFKLACIAHKGQKYGEYDYTYHLENVVDILYNNGFRDDTLIIAWLHDIIEDTNIKIKEIENKFGLFIAECVEMITDKPGKNRKERKAKTYKYLEMISDKYKIVLAVKIADRLSNISSCVKNNNKPLFEMYKNEHENFKKAVYRENYCIDMRNLLDKFITDGVNRKE